MFFSANNALGPPYHILLDTNFINFRSHSLLSSTSALWRAIVWHSP